MWSADNWKDYELLDASDGERLERWGKYILIRPDPQVIWNGMKKDSRWNKADGIYKRSKSGGGSWTVKSMPEKWTVRYGELEFMLRPMGFKHTGLFPEQAVNWEWFSKIISDNMGKTEEEKPRVLNLFAYTGGASAAAAKAGASVCHVDASKGMVGAAKENMKLSGLENAPVRYIVDDCMKFAEREIRRGKKYDGIIMDPPSYGRGPNGELWKLEDCAFELISKTAELLSDEPLFFLINSYTTGLSPSSMGYMLKASLPEKLRERAKIEADEVGLPVTKTGMPLPAGSAARCTFR